MFKGSKNELKRTQALGKENDHFGDFWSFNEKRGKKTSKNELKRGFSMFDEKKRKKTRKRGKNAKKTKKRLSRVFRVFFRQKLARGGAKKGYFSG